jgi:hypothetical protein
MRKKNAILCFASTTAPQKTAQINLRISLNRSLRYSVAIFLLLSLNACSSSRNSGQYGSANIETTFSELKAPAQEIEGLTITSETGEILFNRRAGTLPKADTTLSGGLGSSVPKYFRVVWLKDSGWDDVPIGDPRRTDQYYREDVPLAEKGKLNWVEGKIASRFKVDIADRIPFAVGESLRKDPSGTLIIKLKIFPNTKTQETGVSLGWAIQRNAKNSVGEPYYELVGGDFK